MHSQTIPCRPQKRRLPKDPARVARELRRLIQTVDDEQDECMRLHDEAYAFADRMTARVLELGESRLWLSRALERLALDVAAAARRAAPLDLEAAA